ncbi:hypothetical protein AVM15_03015 [Paraclostridium benzoelyticum]|nr:hypothetical protein AVM15_03015 [Paraclostridium benzoelyticum]
MRVNTEFKEVKGIGKIPVDWESKELDELILECRSGLSRQIKSQDIGIPVMISGNIQNGKLDTSELKYWYRDDPQGSDVDNYLLKDKDILLCFINSLQQIGKLCVYKDIGREAIYTTNLFRIRNNDSVISEFLYYMLSSKYVQNEIINITKPAVNQASFTKGDFLKIKVPYMTLKEQEKIAQILSNVDMNIEKTEQAIAKYKQIKKGLMNDLLTGKVRIKDGKRFRETNFKDVKFLGKRPEGWVFDTFKNVSVVRQGLQIPIGKRFKENNKDRYVYITVQYLRDIYNKTNAYYIENPKGNVICKKEDILMTRTGNTGEVITNVAGVFHNNFFLVDYDKGKLNKDFMVHYLKSSFIQNLISIYAGTTTIPDLNHSEFYRIPIVYPKSIVEQNSIVEVLNYQDIVISKEEKYLEKLKKLKSGLMEDLLTGKVRVNTN